MPAIARAILVWTIIQMVPLTLCATRSSLWLNQSKPEESKALAVIVVLQVAAGALLSPVLFADWECGLATALTTLPFVLLGTLMSGANLSAAIAAWLIELSWFTLLASGMAWTRSATSRPLIATGASLYAIGGASLFYVANEFGSPTSLHQATFQYGPLIASLQFLEGSGRFSTLIAYCSAALILSSTAVLRLRQPSHQLIHKAFPKR